MLIVKIVGFVGLGALVAVPLAACGGGVPDPSESAQGAATGVSSPDGGGSTPVATNSSSTSADASAGPTTTINRPTSRTDGGAGAGPDPAPPKPGAGLGDDDDDDNGHAGGPGRIAVGTDCCFNGTYLRCPNENACTGGGDLNACFDKCADDVDCIEKCADNATNAGPPQGCQPNLPEPPGVDCANGTINR